MMREMADPNSSVSRPEQYKSGEKAWGAGQSKSILGGASEDFMTQLAKARAKARQ